VTAPDAFFLSVRRGRRFCLRHSTGAIPRRGAIVYLHPFAEEMNKARRMAALQARALATAGFAVLQIDLFGCGDSDGEFGAADWDQWLADTADATAWWADETGQPPALWGLRVGCLVACEAAARMDTPANLLLWQPVQQGRQALQQFLRLDLARQLFEGESAGRTGTRQLRERLARDGTLEVAGYDLSDALARGLEQSVLEAPPSAASIAWLEVTPDGVTSLPPAAQQRVDAWRDAGQDIVARAVQGPAFWQTQEIAECPALIAATLDVVAGWR
jgi:exosortase A-associated hydrolase 2